MTVESMQIDLEPVESAGAGDDVGIKVPERVRPNVRVIRVSSDGVDADMIKYAVIVAIVAGAAYMLL